MRHFLDPLTLFQKISKNLKKFTKIGSFRIPNRKVLLPFVQELQRTHALGPCLINARTVIGPKSSKKSQKIHKYTFRYTLSESQMGRSQSLSFRSYSGLTLLALA